MIKELKAKIISGSSLSKDEAFSLAFSGTDALSDIFHVAEAVRKTFFGDQIELCAIVNAKSGACGEDCAYCAQSSSNNTGFGAYPFIGKDAILKQALDAASGGVSRFSIVTSGRKPTKQDIKAIAETLESINKAGLGVCASLGLLELDELAFLRDHGLERYHNNLETSERFFPYICSTHSFKEKIRTIVSAASVGLSICSGGIFGMGESWEDRLDLAFLLKELNVDSMPINFLTPIKGTRLEHLPTLEADEALKVISLMRLIMPQEAIRVCGGRLQALGSRQTMIFKAGADAMMTGNYLVTSGRSYHDDLLMLNSEGLHPKGK
ncbi:MAG TPA: biotin synthase BioB [Dissulfurispiraceae bacterium]|nr:biotin synthase BioB [Dissulfurispiraceae bacterium]